MHNEYINKRINLGSCFEEFKEIANYFTIKNGDAVDLEKVITEMKGPKYRVKSEYYIFRRVT